MANSTTEATNVFQEMVQTVDFPMQMNFESTGADSEWAFDWQSDASADSFKLATNMLPLLD